MHRFYVAVSVLQKKKLECGKNIGDALSCAACVPFLFPTTS